MVNGYISRMEEIGKSLLDEVLTAGELLAYGLLQTNKITEVATDFWGMGHEGGAIKGEETPEVIYFVDHRQPKGHEYVILGYRNFKEGEEQPIGNSNDIIFGEWVMKAVL
jgi:hypothetical protein